MSERSVVEQAVDKYLHATNTDDVKIIPLTEDVVIDGPMIPEPISGETAVRKYLGEVAPFVASIKRKMTVIEGNTAAIVLEFEGLNGVVIEGAEFFRVRDGRICWAQTFFDTRPLISGTN